MKRVLFVTIIIIVCAAVIPQTSFAHELLPKNVVEYLNTHPEASEQDIQDFIRTNSPELAKKVKNKEGIAKILNRNTNVFDNSLDFIKLGIHHILTGPDHILFIVSLLIVFVSWRHILSLTGTFTLAHSITFILAGSGALTLNPRVVEPVIAFSIAYVAFSSVFLRNKPFAGSGRSKIAAVFFFGLFHGLGFAGLLQEIQVPQDNFLTSLISFNIGIELGQIFIVVLCLPLIYAFRKKPWYARCIQIAGAIITMVGIVWGVQRMV